MKSSGKSKLLGSGTKISLRPHSSVFLSHIISTSFQNDSKYEKIVQNDIFERFFLIFLLRINSKNLIFTLYFQVTEKFFSNERVWS